MEKRPPANVGDLERQREKRVHLLGEEAVREPGVERRGLAADTLTFPSPFPGRAAPLPQTCSFSKCLLSFYYVFFTF